MMNEHFDMRQTDGWKDTMLYPGIISLRLKLNDKLRSLLDKLKSLMCFYKMKYFLCSFCLIKQVLGMP